GLFIPVAVIVWTVDPFRVRRQTAALAGGGCLAGIVALSIASPVAPGAAFGDENYVSHFARTGVDAVRGYFEHGFLDSDAAVVERLRAEASCQPARQRPHIILVHDESSFDIRAIKGGTVPPNHRRHFLSLAGHPRR